MRQLILIITKIMKILKYEVSRSIQIKFWIKKEIDHGETKSTIGNIFEKTQCLNGIFHSAESEKQ